MYRFLQHTWKGNHHVYQLVLFNLLLPIYLELRPKSLIHSFIEVGPKFDCSIM
jgi:hypothetical protein